MESSIVLTMAVLLAQRKSLALAMLFLGAFYACLDKCSSNVVRSIGRYDVVTYVDVNFLQLFL